MANKKIIKSKFGLTDNEIKALITYHTDIDRALRLLTNKNKYGKPNRKTN